MWRGAPFDPLSQAPGKGVIAAERYFTPSEAYARRYEKGAGATRAYFLNVRRPFDVRNARDAARMLELRGGHAFHVGSTGALDWAEAPTAEEIEELWPGEYDGLVLDEGGDPAESGPAYRGESVVPFAGGAQVKSATDNTGVFSARPDVRYSISHLYTGSAADYAERVPVLDKDGKRTGWRIDNGPSLVHVGTGEGSQVYGWGLYASNQRGVAEGYATPSGLEIRRHGKVVKPWNDKIAGLIRSKFSSRNPIEAALNVAKENGWDQKDIESLENGDYEVGASHANIYEQTFFTDRADGEETERHLLKWYEPVSEEQKQWVLDLLAKEAPSNAFLPEAVKEASSGEDLYRLLAEELESPEHEASLYPSAQGLKSGEQSASEFLARAGIDGVKYPVDSFGGKGVKDGDSVGWNYVTFRDDNIRVDHKWVDGEQRYSIVPINGRDMMVVANSLLTAKEAQDETKVRDMLRNTIVGKEFAQLGEPTDKPVKVSPKFVKEFWNSEQAKSQRKIAKLWRAKVGAAVNLEDLLATTPLGPKEAPKHTNGQFKNGATFYRCPTKFGVFVPGMGINVYPCNLLILETKSGKRYAFDIADMEKPTLAAIGSLSGETLDLLQGGGSNGGSVRPATLPQAPGSVKTGMERRGRIPGQTTTLGDAMPKGPAEGTAQASGRTGILPQTAPEVNPSRDSFTPLGQGLSNESIFAGLLAADYVSGKNRGDETYERLRRALHVEDAGTLAEARAYAREMAEVRRYGLAGRAEASVRDAAAQGGQGSDAIFGDAPSPDWTAEDYARRPPIRLGNASGPHRILRK